MGDTDPNKPYMAANGHMYTHATRYERDCLDICPCKMYRGGSEPYGRAEDFAGEQWDEDD